jgi:hypothetical protein
MLGQKNSLLKIIRTISYLKLSQIYYLLNYRLRKRLGRHKLSNFINKNQIVTTFSIKLFPTIISDFVQNSISIKKNVFTFNFINLEYSFKSNIDWNYSYFGKLWTYNLNYFDFLFSANCPPEIGLSLIHDFISKLSVITIGLDSYPISIRNMNWIKYLLDNKLNDNTINSVIFGQYELLYNSLEYHLMGNHLLENGFSLIMGGYFLNETKFYKKGKSIISQELKRQILPDGGHFEQSPMYHQIILIHLLDVFNLVSNNDNYYDVAFNNLIRFYASKMVIWLNNISFSNGIIPTFNDTSSEITPPLNKILDYAQSLGVNLFSFSPLTESGFRIIRDKSVECFIDIGNIAATYQPGHSHADTFTFSLNYKDRPIIVDTGISTYEKNIRRELERSTSSHNTVAIDNRNSSEVWSGFRVGRRAKVTILKDTHNYISAFHNGYNFLGCKHHRKISLTDGELIITDIISGNLSTHSCFSYLHFHPDCSLFLNNDFLEVNENIKIYFYNFSNVSIQPYIFCEEFNSVRAASRILAQFKGNATIKLKFVTKC